MLYTLGFIRYNDSVLLIDKKRGLFLNKLNGVGGHCNKDEDPLICFIREVKEETGLDITEKENEILLEGRIHFQNDDNPPDTIFIYSAILKIEDITLAWSSEGDVAFSPISYACDISQIRMAPCTSIFVGNCRKKEQWFYKILYDTKTESIKKICMEKGIK